MFNYKNIPTNSNSALNAQRIHKCSESKTEHNWKSIIEFTCAIICHLLWWLFAILSIYTTTTYFVTKDFDSRINIYYYIMLLFFTFFNAMFEWEISSKRLHFSRGDGSKYDFFKESGFNNHKADTIEDAYVDMTKKFKECGLCSDDDNDSNSLFKKYMKETVGYEIEEFTEHLYEELKRFPGVTTCTTEKELRSLVPYLPTMLCIFKECRSTNFCLKDEDINAAINNIPFDKILEYNKSKIRKNIDPEKTIVYPVAECYVTGRKVKDSDYIIPFCSDADEHDWKEYKSADVEDSKLQKVAYDKKNQELRIVNPKHPERYDDYFFPCKDHDSMDEYDNFFA